MVLGGVKYSARIPRVVARVARARPARSRLSPKIGSYGPALEHACRDSDELNDEF